MKPKTKRIAWWVDGAHVRSKNLQPADGVVITGFRTMLVALGLGAVAAVTLQYTHRNHILALRQYEQVQEQFAHTQERDQEQSELTREGQVTERYVEAIKLLASKNLTERLGGIYALERIMRDSEKDHATVVEVLAAFIRERAAAGDEEGPDEKGARPDEDVQAALTVLGRRPSRGKEPEYINLRHTDLRGADLSDAKFDRVDLRNARLQRAQFARSFLRDAVFQGAVLHKADLSFAHLNGAIFYAADMGKTALWQADATNAVFSYANMEGARLRETRLQGAAFLHTRLTFTDLRNADLAGVMLKDVDLSQAEGLQLEQLAAAVLGEIEHLPPGMSFEEGRAYEACGRRRMTNAVNVRLGLQALVSARGLARLPDVRDPGSVEEIQEVFGLAAGSSTCCMPGRSRYGRSDGLAEPRRLPRCGGRRDRNASAWHQDLSGRAVFHRPPSAEPSPRTCHSRPQKPDDSRTAPDPPRDHRGRSGASLRAAAHALTSKTPSRRRVGSGRPRRGTDSICTGPYRP